MEYEDEFLNNFFTQITQLCFDKAKEYVVLENLYIYLHIIFK